MFKWAQDQVVQNGDAGTRCTTNKGTARWLMERVMAAHTVTKAKKEMDNSIVESDPDGTGYKL